MWLVSERETAKPRFDARQFWKRGLSLKATVEARIFRDRSKTEAGLESLNGRVPAWWPWVILRLRATPARRRNETV
jgi:hypothetical protein